MIFGSLGQVDNKLRASCLGLAGSGITCFICGILPSDMWAWYVFAVTCMFMGGSGSAYNIPFVAYLQETIPAEARGGPDVKALKSMYLIFPRISMTRIRAN